MSVPIGSTVVVQREDGGPWTHDIVVDNGNHNHHSRSYKIQVTKTGRIITCNKTTHQTNTYNCRNFLHNQVNEYTKKDPLDAILDHIQRHPLTPTTKNRSNERPNNNIMPDVHK